MHLGRPQLWSAFCWVWHHVLRSWPLFSSSAKHAAHASSYFLPGRNPARPYCSPPLHRATPSFGVPDSSQACSHHWLWATWVRSKWCHAPHVAFSWDWLSALDPCLVFSLLGQFFSIFLSIFCDFSFPLGTQMTPGSRNHTAWCYLQAAQSSAFFLVLFRPELSLLALCMHYLDSFDKLYLHCVTC